MQLPSRDVLRYRAPPRSRVDGPCSIPRAFPQPRHASQCSMNERTEACSSIRDRGLPPARRRGAPRPSARVSQRPHMPAARAPHISGGLILRDSRRSYPVFVRLSSLYATRSRHPRAAVAVALRRFPRVARDSSSVLQSDWTLIVDSSVGTERSADGMKCVPAAHVRAMSGAACRCRGSISLSISRRDQREPWYPRRAFR
jgi:hypothetical protein